MTRKEEIRNMVTQIQSAIKDKRRKWLPVKDFKKLLSFILELTVPESSPAPLESQKFNYFDQSERWDEVINILEIKQEGRKMSILKSKFILTRRTEGKGRTEGDLEEKN